MNRIDETLQIELQQIISPETGRRSVLEPQDDDSNRIGGLSALQELSQKVALCLQKQQEVRFIIREIADIVKKSS